MPWINKQRLQNIESEIQSLRSYIERIERKISCQHHLCNLKINDYGNGYCTWCYTWISKEATQKRVEEAYKTPKGDCSG